MKIKIFRKILFSLGVLLISVAFSQVAWAAYQPQSRNTCALSIHPYNRTANMLSTLGPYDAEWYRIFHESNPECTQHLQYPNQYTPQPPSLADSPLANKSGVENKKAPTTQHNHVYHNDSVEDNYYYKSFIDKFQITLESDTLQKTNLNQLVCLTPTTGAPIESNCNTTLNVWGGTHITFNQVSGRITWEFGVNSNPKSGRPVIYGKNPGLNWVPGMPNTNLDDNRIFEPAVKLVSKNNPEQIWSGTTTSRVLLRDQAILKTAVNTTSPNYGNLLNVAACENDGKSNSSHDYTRWCTLPTPAVNAGTGVEGTEVVDGKTYYWFKVGVVGTVWKVPALENKCTGLNLTPSSLSPYTPTSFHVEPIFQIPTAPQPNLTYEWKAESFIPGQLLGPGFSDNASLSNFSNPYMDDDKDTYYAGGVPTTIVHVMAYDGTTALTDCQKTLIIPQGPQHPVCQSITLNPTSLNVPGSTNLTATVTFNNGHNYPTQVTWSQTGGAFTQGEVQQHLSSFPYNNTYVTQGNQGSVTARVTNILDADNSPACQQGITITNVPGKQCLDLNITNPDAEDGVLNVTPGQPFTYNFNIQAQTQGNVGLNYRWTDTPATNSTFDGQPDPYIDPNTSTTYFNPNPQDGTIVRVRGLDVFSGDVYGETCEDQVVLSTNTPNQFCEELNLFVNGQEVDELPINQAVTLTAHAELNTGAPVTSLTWTTNEGTLIPMGACVGQSSGQTITLTPSCPVLFTGGPAGTDITVSSVPSGANCLETLTVPDVPEEDCDNLELSHVSDNNYCAYVSPGQYAEDIDWDYSGDEDYSTYNNNRCVHFFDTPQDGTLEAEVPGFGNVCRDALNFEATPPPPPTIEKDVRRIGTTNYSEIVSLSEGQNMVEYRIKFTPPNGYPTTTTLHDTISDGPIEGEYPSQFDPLPGTPQPGRIEYRDTMTVSGIGPCQGNLNNAENCYTGEINTGLKLIKVTVPVTITYRGEIVDSAITEPNCKAGLVCMEIYNNVVNAPYTSYDEDGNEVNESQIMSNIVRVQVFCQYILTRAAGDIFLETDLEQGVDIYKCTPYKSSTGVIITPVPSTPEELTSSGPSQIVQIGHEVCKEGGSGPLEQVYNEKNTSLSSQICEVKLTPGSSWEKTKIVASIDENKTRISRWEPNLSLNIISNVKFLDSSQTGVYHIKGDLTIDNTNGNFIEDGDGAKTFIIEDGDLTIKDNIKIGPCNKTRCTLRDTASLAFIVLNGNINIDPDVKEIAGVYFVQKGDTGTGLLFSSGNANSTERLTVYGMIYGDIQPLFKNRKASGDPGKNEASITIRWDERILLNTPPGLQDIVDVQQNEVAR